MNMTKEYIEKIDLAPLSEIVEKQLGVNPAFGNIEAKAGEDGRVYYFNFSNTNSIDAGVFGKALRKFIVVGYVSTGYEFFQVSIHFQYEFKTGSKSRCGIGNGTYKPDTGEWVYNPLEDMGLRLTNEY